MYPEADPALIQRARLDRSAFGEIYDLYVRRIYAFCLTHTRDRDEAEDVTAQTFERALNAIGRYEERGVPLSSWLLQIAARLMINQGKQASRITLLGSDPVPEPEGNHSSDDDPQVVVERWERAEWLRSRIAALPSDQRRAVQLRYWQGFSIPEVAAQVGRNEGATRQLLHRAMTSLRARIGNHDV
ncbi:MAG TPA: RNA polymerase sigma factor [Chloroflexota bacterium]|nr:RNA polymerase sigma factor [Chloroflexota bacterium]